MGVQKVVAQNVSRFTTNLLYQYCAYRNSRSRTTFQWSPCHPISCIWHKVVFDYFQTQKASYK